MYIAIALLACLDSPPTKAHSTFQQVMSPAIADNLLAAVYVALSTIGAGENHAKPKTGLCRTSKMYGKLLKGSYPHYPATLMTSQAGSQDTQPIDYWYLSGLRWPDQSRLSVQRRCWVRRPTTFPLDT